MAMNCSMYQPPPESSPVSRATPNVAAFDETSFSLSARTSARVAGGLSGSSPAAANTFLL